MKIAYVTTYDAKDISNWSGSGYFIWQSLARAGIEVEFIGPLFPPPGTKKVLMMKQLFYEKMLRKLYLPDHDVIASKAYSREAWRRLQHTRDIEAVVSPGTIPVAFLPGKLPLVTISDATARSLFDTYPMYKNLCGASRRNGDKIEQNAIKRASASVFASDWAARSAIRDYNANAEKVHVVPFGANFERQPAREDVIRAIDSRNNGKIRLLFIGVEWERKGGPVALQVVRTLVKRGASAHLTVIGCNPAISSEDANYVTVRGFIKKTPDGQRDIFSELGKAHFLIVPSVAECYGLVYCEASALGVPSIARNVGGVGTIIKNDVNGRLFDFQNPPQDMADWILYHCSEPKKYRDLALSSLAEYESRLNWAVAGQKLKTILRNVIADAEHTRRPERE
jgi:glycosyltransferase involved in cell wall biosynthesis